MGPMQSISSCLRNRSTSSGRASRSEFWWFALVSTVLTAAFITLTYRADTIPLLENSVFSGIIMLGGFLVLALFVVSVSFAYIRRFHDIGYSGWLPLTVLIATYLLYYIYKIISHAAIALNDLGDKPVDGFSFLLAAIIFLVIAQVIFLFLPSQPGPNKYGSNPQGAAS